MNDSTTKIRTLFKTYKWLLLPIVPMIMFIILLIVLFAQSGNSSTNQQNQQPTNGQRVLTPELTPTPETSDSKDTENPNNLFPDFQKTQAESDGTVIYTFTSDNPKRPNIIITTKEGETIFSRKLNSKAMPLATIAEYQQAYGNPENVIQGTKIYGKLSALYIYGSIGLAFIADPASGSVYEEQTFTPMRVDEYLQKYGNQK